VNRKLRKVNQENDQQEPWGKGIIRRNPLITRKKEEGAGKSKLK